MKKFILTVVGVLATFSFATAGNVTGTIKFDGTAPTFKEIKMDADPVCASHNKEKVFPQTLLLGEGQTMGNVFIYVKNAPKGALATDVITIDQKGCQYEPHVLGIMVNQKAKILNPDGTLHNVHAISKINTEFNSAMPKFRTEIEKSWDKPEFGVALKCDVHPWMGAWLHVMDHPFFTTTKADGQFTIAGLPDGTYQIEAWHEKLGSKSGSVTIAGGDATIDFTFAAPAKK